MMLQKDQFMTKVLIFLFTVALVFCGFACSRKNGANTNAANTADAGQTFTDPQAALAEGNRLLAANEAEAAINAYKQATTLDPDLAEAYFKMGIAYSLIEMQQKRSAEVVETPTPAENGKKPKEIQTESEKAFEKAVEAYKKLIDKNPNDDVAYFNMGRSYNKLNEDQDAEKALRQAVKLKPDDTEYQTELGSILIKLAKYGEAVAALNKALEIDPDNSEAQDLLEDAKAGKKRVDYVQPKKDNSNKTDANANANANVESPANSQIPPPPAARQTPKPPANH